MVGRQPVHTCYVPANRVAASPDLLLSWGKRALSAMDAHAPTPERLAGILELEAGLAERVHARVRAKLAREPVEDLRVDFEDGYGEPGDGAEDADAEGAANVLAEWCRNGAAPIRFGIRFKSFHTPALRERGLRTLERFLAALLAGGTLPPGFVVTFPKVTSEQQVTDLCERLAELERRFGLARGTLRFEIQIETPESIIDPQGRMAPPRFVAAGGGRVSGLHFGTYDYTAGLGLPAASQHLAHGACDFARNVMQVAAAAAGVGLSDGSTNVLPVGEESAVRRGWRTHFDLVRRSLEHGFYAGWDLHPAQLVTRYAAMHAFYLRTCESDGSRLRAYLTDAESTVLDEPATARALAGSMVHALDCGALDDGDIERLAGVGAARLRELTS